MNYKVWIKPMSVNEAWEGRRFKSKAYKDYEEEMLYLLPRTVHIPNPKSITLFLEFGVSSVLFDIDNGEKPFTDILQKKYGFNDRYIFRKLTEKTIVKKGDEFIKFKFEEYKKTDLKVIIV